VCSREMDREMQNSSLYISRGTEGSESGGIISKNLDDDGRPKRTGAYAWRTHFPILTSFFSLQLIVIGFVLMGGGCFLRNMDNCKCPYYHCCDRIWSAIPGMGYSTVRMGGWAACSCGVLFHHFFHVHSSCRFLQVSRPYHWQ